MSESLDLDAIEARANGATAGPRKLWGMSVMADHAGTSSVDDAIPVAKTASYPTMPPRTWNTSFIAHSRADVPALIARVRELTPRVLEGEWETVRDALDALPMGAQIRWTTGDPIHVALAIHRGVHWDATVYGGPLSSENIARDETPIEVIA